MKKMMLITILPILLCLGAHANAILSGDLSVSAFTGSNISCNGASNATAKVSVSGGSSPYTYSWSSGSTTYVAAGLSAGTYSITVTDNNSFTGSATVIITQPAVLFDSVVVSNTYFECPSSGVATIGVTGGATPYTYSWSPNVNSTNSASGLSAGSYMVRVKDNNGCYNIITVNITGPPSLRDSIVSAGVINVSCNGENTGSAMVGVKYGTPSYAYLWNPGGQTNSTATGLSAGTYFVTVSDMNGCTGTTAVTITQPNALSVMTTIVSGPGCGGEATGVASVTVSGGTLPYAYSWSPGGGTGSTISGLSVGTYMVTVQDNCGVLVTGSASIQLLSINAFAAINVSCNGGSNGQTMVSVSGGSSPYTYSWNSGSTTYVANGLSVGTYTVTVTDNNSCSGTSASVITQPITLNDSIVTASIVNILCNGGNSGSAIVGVVGGISPYTYSWSEGGGTNSIVTGLSPSTYTVTVSDSNGCSVTTSVNITQPAAISITTDSIPDNGNCTGSAWVTVNGGVLPYTFSWTGGNTSDSISNKCHGNYCCTVTDANGCIDSVCVAITLSTGIDNIISNSGQVTVYPNPNNGVFILEINPAELVPEWQVEIYNVLGERIYNATLKQVQGDVQMNLSSQPDGIYFYRVLKEDGDLVGEGKIITQKQVKL